MVGDRKTTHLQSCLISLGLPLGPRAWYTEVSGSDLWLNVACVFTAYLGRAVSFSKHKPGIGSLSSMFRLQSPYNSLT